MVFQQQYSSPRVPYLNLVLWSLRNTQTDSLLATTSFARICDQAGIPRRQRGRLLFTLVREGYVTRGGDDQIRMTVAGARLAAAPLN
jgi:DNA-binding IclR family transcriptional regulator